jgi:very-short-patch-repair endonuclease
VDNSLIVHMLTGKRPRGTPAPQAVAMHPAIDRLLCDRLGVASRAELLTVLTRNALDNEVRRGRLIAPFPRAYCRPWDVDLPAVRERAAIVSVQPPVALSHLTALRRWELTAPTTEDVHVTAPIARHPIGRAPSLIVHRTRVPTRVRTVGGLPTVGASIAVVRSWPMLAGPDQRAPAIEAVRRRLVTPDELRAAADRARGMAGRSRLMALIEQLRGGCESELELWGYSSVFDFPGLRHGVRQKLITIDGHNYRLDLAFEAERVAIELDGYRFHSTRQQRERDMRRDAALASVDWVTLRYSHERLHTDVRGCRRDTLATLEARRVAR